MLRIVTINPFSLRPSDSLDLPLNRRPQKTHLVSRVTQLLAASRLLHSLIIPQLVLTYYITYANIDLMEIPVSQQAAEKGWSPDQIVTSLGVEELTRLAERQGYQNPADKAQGLYDQAKKNRDEELAALLGKEHTVGETALKLVEGRVMTNEEFADTRAR